MAEPIVPPAGTPPAEPPAGGQPPAEPPQEPEKKTLTQAEIDAIVEDRLKRDREAREKELGMSTKDAKALIKAKKEADQAAKTKEELLQQERDEAKAEVAKMKLDGFKRTKIDSLIAEKKIKLPDGVSISDVLDMVSGQDEDGITKSLEKLPKFFPFNASMGSGSNPANTPGKDSTIDEKIKAAQDDGLKTGNWMLYNKLTLEKQSKG